MKRFLLATALILVILGTMLYFTPKSMYVDVLNYLDKNATVNIYCRQTSCENIDLGLGFQVTCSVDDFGATVASCRGVDGVSVSFEGSEQDIDRILCRLQATQVSYQQLDDLYVACCYSPRLKGSVSIDGKRVNLQIAYSNGAVTVGYPLILGSY